jgi:hypothetical protein
MTHGGRRGAKKTASLWLINFYQGDNDWRHWAFFIGEDIGTKGTLHHVTSETGQVPLVYRCESHRNPMGSRKFRDSYMITELDSKALEKVEEIMENTDPPRRKSENCQHWCIAVIETMEEAKIVEAGTAANIDNARVFAKYNGTDEDEEEEEGEEEDEEDKDEDNSDEECDDSDDSTFVSEDGFESDDN